MRCTPWAVRSAAGGVRGTPGGCPGRSGGVRGTPEGCPGRSGGVRGTPRGCPGRSGGVVITVDCLGLACPIPVVRLARAVASVEVGAVVELLADDPGARVDIPVWCRLKDQELLA